MYHSSDEKSLCFCFFHFFLSSYYQDWECWLQFKLLGMMLAAHISSLLSNLCPSNTELPPRQLPQDVTSASNPPPPRLQRVTWVSVTDQLLNPSPHGYNSCRVTIRFLHMVKLCSLYAALFCFNKEYSKSLKND